MERRGRRFENRRAALQIPKTVSSASVRAWLPVSPDSLTYLRRGRVLGGGMRWRPGRVAAKDGRFRPTSQRPSRPSLASPVSPVSPRLQLSVSGRGRVKAENVLVAGSLRRAKRRASSPRAFFATLGWRAAPRHASWQMARSLAHQRTRSLAHSFTRRRVGRSPLQYNVFELRYRMDAYAW